MSDLEGVPVFLSASFPSDDARGANFPSDPGVLADAVSAVSTALLLSGARIICGGHPTITPLLLFICDQHELKGRLVVFQSRHFQDRIPAETWRLAREGFADLHFTEEVGDRATDLLTMRQQMLTVGDPQAAVFIGGMEGIHDEWKLADDRNILCLPVRASGGAAADLSPPSDIDEESLSLLGAPSFAIVGREIVRVIRAHKVDRYA